MGSRFLACHYVHLHSRIYTTFWIRPTKSLPPIGSSLIGNWFWKNLHFSSHSLQTLHVWRDLDEKLKTIRWSNLTSTPMIIIPIIISTQYYLNCQLEIFPVIPHTQISWLANHPKFMRHQVHHPRSTIPQVLTLIDHFSTLCIIKIPILTLMFGN